MGNHQSYPSIAGQAEGAKRNVMAPPYQTAPHGGETLHWRLEQGCGSKQFIITPLTPPAQGPAPTGALVAVDLVVLIDTSDSMKDEAVALCSFTEGIVKAAATSCSTNLRINWFGIEGSWPETPVTQSYRQYLHTLGITNAALVGRIKDTVVHQGAQEDGARAITDLARHFDWRLGATRLLLYLGDEALEGGDPADAAEPSAIAQAIAAAQAHAVSIFAYLGTGQRAGAPDVGTHLQYRRLAVATGGQAYAAPYQTLLRFEPLLRGLLCAADNGSHRPSLPAVRPCFTLRWGDGPTDRMETFDHETLCLEVSNPYRNVIFHDLIIATIEISRQDGTLLPLLPDGTPALTLHPARQLAFPDLLHADAPANGTTGANHRELLLVCRGAPSGDYWLTIRYHCRAELILQSIDNFPLTLVAS